MKKRIEEDNQAQISVEMRFNIPTAYSVNIQNALVKEIIEKFAARFTPGGRVLYVGDADKKFAFFEADALQELGVTIAENDKMPNVLIHHTDKNWLVILEAATSHGAINAGRKAQLQELFSAASAGLVFVSAFQTRQKMVSYLTEIAFETHAWVADEPDHLIHFNGERFLGHYGVQ